MMPQPTLWKKQNKRNEEEIAGILALPQRSRKILFFLQDLRGTGHKTHYIGYICVHMFRFWWVNFFTVQKQLEELQ